MATVTFSSVGLQRGFKFYVLFGFKKKEGGKKNDIVE